MKLYLWTYRTPASSFIGASYNQTKPGATAERKSDIACGLRVGPLVTVDLPEPGEPKAKRKKRA